MIIGNFKKAGEAYEGKIETFVFSIPVKLEPVTNKQNENAPDLRFIANEKAIGAAWEKTDKNGKKYHSVALDHPGLDTGCALFKTTEGDGLVLVYNQPPKKAAA